MTGPEYASMLREIADWYEAYPTLPAPSLSPFNAFVATKEALVAVARSGGGPFDKGRDTGYVWLRKVFLRGGVVEFNVPRTQVCTRRVVGLTSVPERIIPAHQEEIVEWDCEPLLGDEA